MLTHPFSGTDGQLGVRAACHCHVEGDGLILCE
jgi:hypothetical protein